MQTRLIYKGFGLVVGLILTAVVSLSILQAAESKPVFTISTTNPETLYQIAEKIATLTGNLDAFNESTAPYKELKGINPKNPIVFVLHTEGDEFKDPILFLPITDLEKIEIPGFEMVLAQTKKESDGKYLLNSPAGAYTLTRKKGYLVAAPESSEMPIPDDPVIFIKGMEAYSLGIRVDLENTSAEAIQTLLAFPRLMAGMQGGEQAIQAFDQIDRVVDVVCKEARSMTFGITIDPKTGDSSIVGKIVAKKGSDTEKQIAFLKGAKTAFKAFCGNENAVMSVSYLDMGVAEMPDVRKMTEEGIDQLIAGILEQVEENATEDDDVELANAITKSAKKIILATVLLDKIDFAFSWGNDGTFALGTSLAEGQELGTIGSLLLKRLKKLSPEVSETVLNKMKTNYTTVEGFQLSSFVFPFKEIAAQDENLPKVLADKTFYTYWGLKNDAFVLWGGFDPNSEERLKSAIAATKTLVAGPGSGGFFSMPQLGKFLKDFQVDQMEAGEGAALVVKTLLQSGADAKITISQTVDKDSLEQQISVNGKVWEAFSKIAGGAAAPGSGGAPNLKIREFK